MKSMMLTACTTCAKMNVTNNCDVQIAMWIMIGIVAIVAICVVGFILLKYKELNASALSEVNKRKWEIEDKEYKRKTELLDLKLKKLNEADYISEIDKVLNEK